MAYSPSKLAATDGLRVGGRFIGGGLAVGSGSGYMLAAGPSASYAIAGPVRIGGSLLVGAALVTARTEIHVP